MRLSMLIFSISTSSRSWRRWSRSYGLISSRRRLLLGGRDHQVGRQDVGEAVRVVDLEGRDQALEGQMVGHLGVLLEGARAPATCRPASSSLSGYSISQGLDLGGRARPPLFDGDDLRALHALDHHLHVAVRELEVLDDRRDHAELEDVALQRLVDLAGPSGSPGRSASPACARVCSRARTEASRPTMNGAIMCGKTTMSRSGTSGRLRVSASRSRTDSWSIDQYFRFLLDESPLVAGWSRVGRSAAASPVGLSRPSCRGGTRLRRFTRRPR